MAQATLRPIDRGDLLAALDRAAAKKVTVMLSAFPPLASHLHGAETVLTGCLDRSALYGALAKI